MDGTNNTPRASRQKNLRIKTFNTLKQRNYKQNHYFVVICVKLMLSNK